KACQNCAKSKCRCVTKAGGRGCERCHRQKIPCLPGNSIRKRNAHENIAINRISQLEGKLDGLVSLLGCGPQLNVVPSGSPSAPVSFESPSPRLSPTRMTTVSPGSVGMSASGSGSAFKRSTDEAEECLAIFRSQMLHYFAFLNLPEDTQRIQQERPFLLLCIIAASSKSTPRRLALGKEIKQTLAQRFILDNRGVINLDLLLGLLTFLAWGHDQLLNDTPTSLSRYTQLAMAFVFELRLNKPSPEETRMLPVNSSIQSCSTATGGARSLEERRAVLACYVMSSVISSYFAQIDAMQWTPYMNESLVLLSQSTDSPSDELFAYQVRLQVIEREFEFTKATTMPPVFYFKALQTKLEEVKATLPPHLQRNEIMLAATYHAELSISELLLSKSPSDFQRLECLYSCLNAVKSALDNFFTFPPAAYLGFSFPFFTQLARYIVVLYKLSILDDSLWDTGLVRSTVDVLAVVDRVIWNLQHADVTGGDSAVDGVFARSARIFMSVKAACSCHVFYT
ncbi:hypothetical protein K490DRAFT_50133, partial [Saccharata proteae CBS 121410]